LECDYYLSTQTNSGEYLQVGAFARAKATRRASDALNPSSSAIFFWSNPKYISKSLLIIAGERKKRCEVSSSVSPSSSTSVPRGWNRQHPQHFAIRHPIESFQTDSFGCTTLNYEVRVGNMEDRSGAGVVEIARQTEKSSSGESESTSAPPD
jgi:hypothetical protein